MSAAKDRRGGERGVDRRRGVFMISVAAELAEMHPQTLRMYEARGLITPKRSPKNTRLYSYEDVERLRRIQRMTAEEGLNLAGVESVLTLERELERARAEVPRCAAAPTSSSAGWPRSSSAFARPCAARSSPTALYETELGRPPAESSDSVSIPIERRRAQARVTSSERVVGAGLAAGRLAIGAGLWVAPDAAARALGFERARLRRSGAGPDRGQPRPRPRRLAALLARRPRSASPRDARRRAPPMPATRSPSRSRSAAIATPGPRAPAGCRPPPRRPPPASGSSPASVASGQTAPSRSAGSRSGRPRSKCLGLRLFDKQCLTP